MDVLHRTLWLCALAASPLLALAQAVPSADPALLERSRRLLDAPAAQRPGDDKLSCAQIHTEIGTLWSSMDKQVGTLGATAQRAREAQDNAMRSKDAGAASHEAEVQKGRAAVNEHAAASVDLMRTGMQGGQFERMKALQELSRRKRCPPPQGFADADTEDDDKRPGDSAGAEKPGLGRTLRGLIGR